MTRFALPLAVLVAIGLIAAAAWSHHRRELLHKAVGAPQSMTQQPVASATDAANPARAAALKRAHEPPDTPLGAQPTPTEIEALTRATFAELERQGGIGVALSQTGQRLPDAHYEMRGLRMLRPCEPHDGPTEHPHWRCEFEVETRVPHYHPDYSWDPRDENIARLPTGGIDTLQQVVRVERGLPRE